MRRRRPTDKLAFDIDRLKSELALVSVSSLATPAAQRRLTEINRTLSRLRVEVERLKTPDLASHPRATIVPQGQLRTGRGNMATVVTRILIEGVGIILSSQDDEEWKFVDWQQRGTRISRLRPSDEDCERCFGSVDQAVQHFREHYAEELATQQP